MFWHTHRPEDQVYVVPGVIENPDSLMDIAGHIFVGDTIDGGFSEWLRSIGQKSLPRWSNDENGQILSPEWKGSPEEDLTPDTLRAHCKCKGVEFLIKRPRQSDEVGKSSPPLQ